jgi:hypothetical protein
MRRPSWPCSAMFAGKSTVLFRASLPHSLSSLYVEIKATHTPTISMPKSSVMIPVVVDSGSFGILAGDSDRAQSVFCQADAPNLLRRSTQIRADCMYLSLEVQSAWFESILSRNSLKCSSNRLASAVCIRHPHSKHPSWLPMNSANLDPPTFCRCEQTAVRTSAPRFLFCFAKLTHALSENVFPSRSVVRHSPFPLLLQTRCSTLFVLPLHVVVVVCVWVCCYSIWSCIIATITRKNPLLR